LNVWIQLTLITQRKYSKLIFLLSSKVTLTKNFQFFLSLSSVGEQWLDSNPQWTHSLLGLGRKTWIFLVLINYFISLYNCTTATPSMNWFAMVCLSHYNGANGHLGFNCHCISIYLNCNLFCKLKQNFFTKLNINLVLEHIDNLVYSRIRNFRYIGVNLCSVANKSWQTLHNNFKPQGINLIWLLMVLLVANFYAVFDHTAFFIINANTKIYFIHSTYAIDWAKSTWNPNHFKYQRVAQLFLNYFILRILWSLVILRTEKISKHLECTIFYYFYVYFIFLL